MMKLSVIAATVLASACLVTNAQAMDFGKPITASVKVTQPGLLSGSLATKKEVTLMNLKLTSAERKALTSRAIEESADNASMTGNSHRDPLKVDIGMNNVPVLDQGRHGSCVTFADTAAVDAALGKGDYISQLCSLELGSYLEKNSYMPSGWDGSLGPLVLEQMMRFGVVSIANQKKHACANVDNYPTNQASNTGSDMSLPDYKAVSEDLNNQIYWEHVLSNDQLFDIVTNPSQMTNVLKDVKASLAKGNRLTFGTVIVLAEACDVGACASYHNSGDTWAYSREIKNPNNELAGHEMVIIGYDDNAVAVDNDGKKHVGLLKLRNSWGPEVGDKGNYYMTYEYFKKYAMEVQMIAKVTEWDRK